MFDKIKIDESYGFLDEVSRLHNDEEGILFNDNQAAIQIAQNELPTKKSRHFSLRLAYIKEFIRNIAFVPTDYNKSDMETKPLSSGYYPLLFYTEPFDKRKFARSILSAKEKKEKDLAEYNSEENNEGSKVKVKMLHASDFVNHCEPSMVMFMEVWEES